MATTSISPEELAGIRRSLPEKFPEVSQQYVSTAELNRRWAAVREAMAEEKIDALILGGYSGYGYLKWFTDMAISNYLGINSFFGCLVFPRTEEMTLVFQGETFG